MTKFEYYVEEIASFTEEDMLKVRQLVDAMHSRLTVSMKDVGVVTSHPHMSSSAQWLNPQPPLPNVPVQGGGQ